MPHSALLAWRSPPRLSRCRRVRPEEASSGAAPHRQAPQRALVAEPAGVVPGGGEQRTGHVGTGTEDGHQPRCGRARQAGERGLQPGDLCGQGLVAPGELPHGQLGRRDRVGWRLPAPQGGDPRDPGSGGQRTQLTTQRFWGADDQRVELVGGLRAGLERERLATRSARMASTAPSRALGLLRRCRPGQHVRPLRRRRGRTCPGGVGSAGWADRPRRPAARRRAGSGPGQRRRRRCLDTEPVDATVPLGPGQQLLEPVDRRGGLGGGQHAAALVDCGRDMAVFVGVDPTGDPASRCCGSCHGGPFGRGMRRRATSRGGGQVSDGPSRKRKRRAPMRSRPRPA
jgi:hypothetical protein